MTNQQPSPCPDAVDASITSMVRAGGGHRRPVKIVEHPAFRRRQQAAGHRDVAHDGAPLLAVAFRVVSLN